MLYHTFNHSLHFPSLSSLYPSQNMISTFTSPSPPSFFSFLVPIPDRSISHLRRPSNLITTSSTLAFSSKDVANGHTPQTFNARYAPSSFLCKSIFDGYTLQNVIISAPRDRLQLLATEFLSLKEPIERVKRLLEYAARLPPFHDASRSPANKVTGCTTQVWLEVSMDDEGKMRFRADSDSEITKGFIWCLIYVLDGAEPAEVVAVKADEMAALNVGLYGKEQSRVNTWHNILIAMQNKTKDFMTRPNFAEAKLCRFPAAEPINLH